MKPTVDDVYWIERTSRHLTSAIEGFVNITPENVPAEILRIEDRLRAIDAKLIAFRDRNLARLGLTPDDAEGWRTP